MSNLDSVLNGTDEAEDNEELETVDEAEETTGEEEESAEAQEPEAEEDSTPEPKSEEKEESWTKAAVLDERRKRQELEARLKEYESRKQEPKTRPDVFEDAEGAFRHTEESFSDQMRSMRLDMSVEMMKTAKPDYAEKEAAFIELASENPELVAQMNRHPNPARFAYETAEKHQKWQEMQNVDEYRSKLEAEIRGKLEQEFAEKYSAKAEAQAKKKAAITPSLTDARSSPGTEESTDDSLDSILQR